MKRSNLNHRYDLFKARREALGMTFEEAVIASGLSKGAVHRAEKITGNPNANTLKKLSRAYKMNPAFTMNFEITKDDFLRAVGNGSAAR